jgi:hypothetical protein
MKDPTTINIRASTKGATQGAGRSQSGFHSRSRHSERLGQSHLVAGNLTTVAEFSRWLIKCIRLSVECRFLCCTESIKQPKKPYCWRNNKWFISPDTRFEKSAQADSP